MNTLLLFLSLLIGDLSGFSLGEGYSEFPRPFSANRDPGYAPVLFDHGSTTTAPEGGDGDKDFHAGTPPLIQSPRRSTYLAARPGLAICHPQVNAHSIRAPPLSVQH